MKTKNSPLFLVSCVMCLLALRPLPSALSQIPQGFNYQAVVRDGATGNPIIEDDVQFRFTIQTLASVIVYQETHAAVTDEFGAVSIVIGQGTPVGAYVFSDINWSAAALYLKTEIEYPVSGTPDYDKNLGIAQIWAVPYSLVAKDVEGPVGKLGISGETTDDEEALFEVRNKDGQIVFAVYNEGIRAYVNEIDEKGAKGGFAIGGFGTTKEDEEPQNFLFVSGDSVRVYIDNADQDPIKGPKGGFAIGGFGTAKTGPQNLLTVSNDSVRIYIDSDDTDKGPKGGFAIGGFGTAKTGPQKFMTISNDSVRIYVDNNTTDKGPKGGFAIGGYGADKSFPQKLLTVSNDSIRIYIDDSSKGPKGGFAIGGFDQGKGEGNNVNFFNVATSAYDTIPSQPRILWYPLKNAFLAGQILILTPDSVGLNSMATGFESRAKGSQSQAMGYQAVARGNYSTAIGKNAFAGKDNSFAFGDGVSALRVNSYAFGKGSIARGDYAFALGNTAIASGYSSYAFGESVTASGSYSYAFGKSSSAQNSYAFALGNGAAASGFSSYALGESVTASHPYTYAFGKGSTATNDNAVAMGYLASASGKNSFAINGTASGEGSKALGGTASGKNSLSSGTTAEASAEGAVAMGTQAYASGANSFAMGYKVKATANQSFSIGMGELGTAEVYNEANGVASMALGQDNQSNLNGSVTLGTANISNGLGAFAMGFHNTATAAFSTVIGSYGNAAGDIYAWNGTEALFVIGNGDPGVGTLSNAVTVLKNGNVGIGYAFPDCGLDILKSPAANYYVAKIRNSSGLSTSHGLLIHAGSSSSGGASFISFQRPNSVPKGLPIEIGRIWQDAVGSVAYYSASDKRTKTQIEETRFGISDLMRVKVRDYEFIGDPEEKVNTGFVAQELYEAYPEAVLKPLKKRDLWYIDYGRMTPLIVKAVQDQQEEIESLKDTINKLEALVEKLMEE